MFPEHEQKTGTMIVLLEAILSVLEMLLIEDMVDASEPRRYAILTGLS